MPNIKQLSDAELWQYLVDLQNEEAIIKLEIDKRLETQHGALWKGVKEQTRKAMNQPSVMELLRLEASHEE